MEMDTAPYIDAESGSTYIPLRYAAESLGFNVRWEEGETANKIFINK